MKIKLRELYSARDVLDRVFAEAIEVKLAYRLSRIAKKVASEMKLIEAQRIELVKKHADEQTEEERAKKAPLRVILRVEEFTKEFGDFLDEDIDIDTHPVKLELLSEIKLSASDIVAIDKFIEVEED